MKELHFLPITYKFWVTTLWVGKCIDDFLCICHTMVCNNDIFLTIYVITIFMFSCIFFPFIHDLYVVLINNKKFYNIFLLYWENFSKNVFNECKSIYFYLFSEYMQLTKIYFTRTTYHTNTWKYLFNLLTIFLEINQTIYNKKITPKSINNFEIF